MILGDLVGLKFPNICRTGEEKSGKKLAKETCLEQGSIPDPLLDKRACYCSTAVDQHVYEFIIMLPSERSEQVWTGVTGISLFTADALAAENGQRRIVVIQPHTFP